MTDTLTTPGAMAAEAIALIAQMRGVERFTDADVSDSIALVELARDFAQNTPAQPGTFLAKMAAAARLTVPMARACLNIALERAAKPQAPAQPVERPEAPVGEAIADGYYTVSFGDGTHMTLRLRPHWDEREAARGAQVAAYLNGPDNGSDYAKFAFLSGRRAQVWRKFDPNGRPARALRILLGMPDPGDAGRAYAAASGNCWRCGKLLTDPVSIQTGLGPICRSK